MIFILREVAGWLLVVLALALVYMALGFVNSRQVVEAMVAVLAANFIFRGGIQLIKASTAARICLTAKQSEVNAGTEHAVRQ